MSTKKQADEKLIQAIKDGRSAAVNEMLQNGCDPNCRVYDTSKRTPALIVAVMYKRFECLKLLLAHHASVNTCDYLGMSAVMYAADMGLTNYLHILAENGADLNAVNEKGANALMLACNWDKFDCVHYLLEHISDINSRDKEGKTALIYATKQNSTECFNLLIDAHADLNIADSINGFTALMYALQNRHFEIAEIILNHDVEVNAKGIEKGREMTALTLAFDNSRNIGEFTMIEKLLLHGADVTICQRDQGYLHEMIARGKKEIVRMLVINGCPPFDRRCWEYTFDFSEHKIPISPLSVALLSGFYDIAKYFIVNRYFTSYDITTLPNDPGIRKKLEERGEDSSQALEIHKLICSSPCSLKVLTFVNILTVVSKITSYIRRRDSIMNSGLPQQLQSQLLFTNWTSQICVLSWHELTLEEDQDLEKCNNCSLCQGNGFRVKKEKSTYLTY